MNINILSSFLIAVPDQLYSHWSFFADITNSNLKIEEIVKEIEKIDVVSEISFIESKFNGLIIDTIHFPIKVLDERSLTLRTETIVSMFNRIYQIFGSGGKVIIFEMGFEAGIRKIKRAYERYNIKNLNALELILD